MKKLRNRLVVDTIGQIKFSDGYFGPGVMLAGDRDAIKAASRLWASGVVLLGCDDLDDLADRIESVMDDINDMDVGLDDFALAVACDLIGKDLSEALRERQEAEDAA